MDDIYRNPGPLQFDGPGADARPIILSVEDQDYMGRVKKLQEYLDKVNLVLLMFHVLSSSLASHEHLTYWLGGEHITKWRYSSSS